MSQPHDKDDPLESPPPGDLIGAAKNEVEGLAPAPGSVGGEQPGDQIDRYRLLREIGEGGMGTVWLAAQSEPVERRVALKIIKLGMDTKEVVARFEAERQALALMDHPHIAKVLDGGSTETGRPYFVMELVQGAPITDCANRYGLPLEDRLKLFVQVCQALQHAHLKGVIHRDIKPSNVLVAMKDDELIPKVIDFGIAKATNAELTQKTLFTRHERIIGTPDYMAPEQAETSSLDIDTRADIYSLGVLLYELLTGLRPFDFQTILQDGFDEFLRTIREVDPIKPSTRVSTAGGSLFVGSEQAESTAISLSKSLRGDLDWIVMKALEKDRTRRYQSASSFALDVERFLRDEAVEAHPQSTIYRLRKLVRRHKKSVAAATTLLLVLAGGTLGTAVGWYRTNVANKALDVALSEKESQRLLAIDNAKAAEQAAEKARTESTRAQRAEQEAKERAHELEQVSEFQARLVETIDPSTMGLTIRRHFLDSVPADMAGNAEALLASVNFTDVAVEALDVAFLRPALTSIDDQFAQEPLLRAYLLQAVARASIEIGLLDLARSPQERALQIRREHAGDSDRQTLESLCMQGLIHRSSGSMEKAQTYFEEALSLASNTYGQESPESVDARLYLGSTLTSLGLDKEAERVWTEALNIALRIYGEDDRNTYAARTNLGDLFTNQGRFEEAERMFRTCLKGLRRSRGPEHRQTLLVTDALGKSLLSQGKWEEAATYIRMALEGRERVLGSDHPHTLQSVHRLGRWFERDGNLPEAEAHYRRSVQGRRRALGERHPSVIRSLQDLVFVLGARLQWSEAETHAREALDAAEQTFGPNHSTTITLTASMGTIQRGLGRPLESARLYRQALELARLETGVDSVVTRDCFDSLRELLETGTPFEVERLFRDEIDAVLDIDAEAFSRLGDLARGLATPLARQSRFAEARATLEEARDYYLEVADEEDPRVLSVLIEIGSAMAAEGDFEEAEAIMVENAETLLDQWSPQHLSMFHGLDPRTGLIRRLVSFYETWHRSDPSGGFDAEAESWRDRLAGD